MLTIDVSGVTIGANSSKSYGTIPIHPETTHISAVATGSGEGGLRAYVNADGTFGIATGASAVSNLRVMGEVVFAVS